MICAIRSAFFRLVRTGLLVKVIIFSVIMGTLVIFSTIAEQPVYYLFSRPRYLDNTFIIRNIAGLLYVVPFAAAVFCTLFTGSDISSRSANNKIATGIPRIVVYLADLVISALMVVLSVIIQFLVFYAFAKTIPVKDNVKFNGQTAGLALSIIVAGIAFVSVDLLFQYFFTKKLLALIASVLVILCLMIVTSNINNRLEEPYRYYVMTDEETETYEWIPNDLYVGGTARNILTSVYEISPYNDDYVVDTGNRSRVNAAAGAVALIFAAAGMVSVKRKEFP